MTKKSSSLFTPHSSLKTTRWLITGGCGFIGTSLIKNLVSENGHYIRVLDNLSVGTREDLARVCEFTEKSSLLFNNASSSKDSSLIDLIVGDIRDYTVCHRCSQDIDVVVHLAASTGVAPSVEDPKKDMESNVIGTFNMLEASRNNGVKRFVFASSGAPVGECDPPIHEELAPHPVSPYGAGKLAGEGYCSSYFRTYGIETVSLRFGNVYGPGSTRKNSVIAKFIKQALGGEVLEIYGDGKQTRDFIYIDDLINAIRLSASKGGVGGETFQIATSSETTIKELVEILIPMLRGPGIEDVKVTHSLPRLGDVLRNFSDTSKAKNMLGWQAQISLTDGLRLTAGWFLGKRF